MKKGGE